MSGKVRSGAVKCLQKRPHRAWTLWLAVAALPSVALAQSGAAAPAAAAASDVSAAERMARAERVAGDPLRRIREAARMGGGPGKPGAPVAAAVTPVSAPAVISVAVRRTVAPTVAASPAPAAAPAAAPGPVATTQAAVAALPAAPTRAVSTPAAVDPVPTASPVAGAVASTVASTVATLPAAAPTAAAATDPSPAAEQAGAALPLQAVAAAAPRSDALRTLPAPGPAPGATPEAADAVAVPRLLQMVEPDFSGRGLREADTLRFQVRLSIAADGSVHDVVVQGAGDRQLNRAVRDAVSRWRYEPPTRPLSHTVDLVVRFDT